MWPFESGVDACLLGLGSSLVLGVPHAAHHSSPASPCDPRDSDDSYREYERDKKDDQLLQQVVVGGKEGDVDERSGQESGESDYSDYYPSHQSN